MEFNERLKETRIAKGLSQMKLAKEMGFTQQAIALWEAGERQPTADAIKALCRALEVSADYLLGLSDN